MITVVSDSDQSSSKKTSAHLYYPPKSFPAMKKSKTLITIKKTAAISYLPSTQPTSDTDSLPLLQVFKTSSAPSSKISQAIIYPSSQPKQTTTGSSRSSFLIAPCPRGGIFSGISAIVNHVWTQGSSFNRQRKRKN